MNSKYKCLKCDHEFNGHPGPVNFGCPKCKHKYLKWLNYEEQVEKKFK